MKKFAISIESIESREEDSHYAEGCPVESGYAEFETEEEAHAWAAEIIHDAGIKAKPGRGLETIEHCFATLITLDEEGEEDGAEFVDDSLSITVARAMDDAARSLGRWMDYESEDWDGTAWALGYTGWGVYRFEDGFEDEISNGCDAIELANKHGKLELVNYLGEDEDED